MSTEGKWICLIAILVLVAGCAATAKEKIDVSVTNLTPPWEEPGALTGVPSLVGKATFQRRPRRLRQLGLGLGRELVPRV